MSKFHRVISDAFGFVRQVLSEGNHRTTAYIGKATVMVGPDSLNVVVLARNQAELERAYEVWKKGSGVPFDTEMPLNKERVYPVALMHEIDVKLEDEEL